MVSLYPIYLEWMKQYVLNCLWSQPIDDRYRIVSSSFPDTLNQMLVTELKHIIYSKDNQ